MERKEQLKHGGIIAACSLFAQGVHWFVFEKVAFESAMLWLTPLILCMLYHFVMADSGEGKPYSRKFVFLCAVVIPLLLSIIGTLLIWLNYPHLSLFREGVAPDGSLPEVLGLLCGRITLTSTYMAVFTLPDLLLLKYLDGRKQA